MKFKSRIEAYTFALYLLSVLRKNVKDASYINLCMENIRIAVENHELDEQVVMRSLRHVKKHAENKMQSELLEELLASFRGSEFDAQTLNEKFENPLRRRFESEIAVLLLKKPTKSTMHAVGRISKAIIDAINFNFTNSMTPRQKIVLDKFLSCLVEEGNTVCLGAFKNKPSLNEIKEVLSANSPDALAQIMQIHYRFARYAFRDLPLNIPVRTPCGAYADLVRTHYGSLVNYASAVRKMDISTEVQKHKHAPGYADRGWISDEIFYASPLYQNEPLRGRVAVHETKHTNRLGLMLLGQKEDAGGLPLENTHWLAECDDHLPDLKSRTVRDYLENEAIYVTGPSGMTSLLLGQMEVLGNFEFVQMKQHYLSAVIAFIAAAGLHSLHEIIGPAEYALRLVPGYQIAPPDIVLGGKAPGPHYYDYFCVMSDVDAEFTSLRKQAWKHYLAYFEHVYLNKLSVRERLKSGSELLAGLEQIGQPDSVENSAPSFRF